MLCCAMSYCQLLHTSENVEKVSETWSFGRCCMECRATLRVVSANTARCVEADGVLSSYSPFVKKCAKTCENPLFCNVWVAKRRSAKFGTKVEGRCRLLKLSVLRSGTRFKPLFLSEGRKTRADPFEAILWGLP